MKKLIAALVSLIFIASPALAQEASPTPTPDAASTSAQQLKDQQAQIDAKQQQIDQLQNQINSLTGQRNTVAADASAIDAKIKILAAELAKAELQLKQTQTGIAATAQTQKNTQVQIDDLQKSITNQHAQLSNLLGQLYQQEQVSWVSVFFDNLSLSQVLAQANTYKDLQNRTIALIKDMHQQEADLTVKSQQLEEQQQSLQNLKDSLADQQVAIDAQKKQQQQAYQTKKNQQAAYESKIAEVEIAKSEIKKQIFTLKSGGVTVSLNSAFDMARFAGKLTGIRPSLLLGVLKVESGLGANVGSGHYPDNVYPSSRPAFLRITSALGLDPTKAPVSRSGAMGPGQFMPATWEGVSGRISQMLNKAVPDPYNLTDAFLATAIFLADKGATNPALEREAVQRYNAGYYWQSATRYGDIVLAVAAEYAAQGL